MQRLRVLRSLFSASVDYSADGDRRRALTAEHVAPLRSLIHDLIDREKHEVDTRVNDDWPVTAQCCPDRGASACSLGHGRIKNPIATELLVEIGHRIADVPGTP